MVNDALSIAVRQIERHGRYGLRQGKSEQASGKTLSHQIHLFCRDQASDAADLIDRFGVHAADEAAIRAERSRGLGNAIHYCRWRQIGRMVELLGQAQAEGTIH